MHKALGVISLLLTVVGAIVQFSGTGNSRYDAKDFSMDRFLPNEKYWMLEGYMDSILKYKSIAKNSFEPLVLDAIVLRIEEDTFYTTGTLNSTQTRKESANFLGNLERSGKFQFLFDFTKKRIMATDFSNRNDRKVYTYVPISEAEYRQLFRQEDALPLQQGVNKLLTRRLFAGEYQSLQGKRVNMTLNEDGSVSGFQHFDKFVVHDYFGTSHPYQGLDVIWLESDRQKGSYYNWKFSADTLILTEMIGDEEYFLGKKSYRFLKKA